MTQKASILQVIPRLDTGGAELSTIEIVDALSATGTRALVATEGGRMGDTAAQLGGELVFLPMESKNPLKIMRNAQLLAKLIKEKNISLVHARSRAPAWSSLLACRWTNTPFVTTYHGAYSEQAPFKRFYNSVMARGDLVIANSKYTAELVRSRHKLDEARMRIIYRGVDIDRFSKTQISSQRLEDLAVAWGVNRSKRIILHPARLTTWKGQAVVIEAARKLQLQSLLDDTVFILAGDHQGRVDYLEGLRAQIARHGLEENVRLVGHCSDMAAAYGLAYVTIIASIEPEAFGRTSAEAQALGCPVIATNIGAPPETVRAVPVVAESEITGWLVPPESSDELAGALGQALEMSPNAYESLSDRARTNVVNTFTDHRMKLQTLAVYDELLGTGLADDFREKTKKQS